MAATPSWTSTLRATAIACVHALYGCGQPGAARPSAPEPAEASIHVRAVRVQIYSSAEEVRVRGDGPLRVAHADASAVLPGGEWMTFFASRTGGVVRGGTDEEAAEWELCHPGGGAVWLSGVDDGRPMPARPYPGRLRVAPSVRGGVTVVNEVDLEEYVACVTARETWPWAPLEAYRAQAVAIRSYALHWMRRRQSHPYDVSADQASQVYAGRVSDRTGLQAREAAESTRGVVCAALCDGRPLVLPAYYSAACGGWTQSTAAFGGGPEPPLPPLAGGVRCPFCRQFDQRELAWGAVTISTSALVQRLRPILPGSTPATPPIDIDAVYSGDGPRPLSYRLVWTAAVGEPIPAERFRLAIGAELMRSTLCQITVSDGEVVFSDGLGAGHGVGLCQRGACVMARQGRTAAEILRFYYPGITLARAY